MICTIENFENYNLLTIDGSITNDHLDILRDQMDVVFKQVKDIIIDIKNVDFICSAGLSVFLAFTNNAHHKKVFYCGPNSSLRNLFQITGIDRNLNVVPTIDDAIASL